MTDDVASFGMHDRAGNRGERMIRAERAAAVRTILERGGLLPLARRRVLDLDCGSGEVLAGFTELGAAPEDLYGVDLCPEEIEAARRAHPEVHWQCATGEELRFAPGFFGLVLAFDVFSAVHEDAAARALAAQVDRVLHREGALLWYERRHARGRGGRGVTPARVRELFPGWRCELQTITVLPSLVRRLGVAAPVLYGALSRLRPLRTHLIGLLRKPPSDTAEPALRTP